MSGANDDVNLNNPTLLTLKGQIAVHFLDGDVIEGELTSQDAFNIFLTVDNEPMMIPRHQIKFIKGKHVDQIEEDNSQANFVKAKPVQESAPPPSSRATTEEYAPITEADGSRPAAPVATPSETPEEGEDDSTFVLPSEAAQVAMTEEEVEDDSTFVLSPGADDWQDEDDEDATFVLPPDTDQTTTDEEEEGTVILGQPEADEVVAGYPPGSAVEDLEPTERPSVVLEQDVGEVDEDDATFVMPPSQEKGSVLASLVCTAGPHSGQVFKLQKDTITVGRSSDNDVALSGDKEISRHHAIILKESGKFVIQDQDSLNGTFVNSEPVTGPRYLEDEDMIVVGISTLKYQEE